MLISVTDVVFGKTNNGGKAGARPNGIALALIGGLLALLALGCDNGGSGGAKETCRDVCDAMIDCDGGDDDTFDGCVEACLDLVDLTEEFADSCEEAFLDYVECANDTIDDLLDEDASDYEGELREFLEDLAADGDSEAFFLVLTEFCDDENVENEFADSCEEEEVVPVD